MIDEKEEQRKWLADVLRAGLNKLRLHPAPYRPALSMTLELHKPRIFTN